MKIFQDFWAQEDGTNKEKNILFLELTLSKILEE
jgi:hypothetical protein